MSSAGSALDSWVEADLGWGGSSGLDSTLPVGLRESPQFLLRNESGAWGVKNGVLGFEIEAAE